MLQPARDTPSASTKGSVSTPTVEDLQRQLLALQLGRLQREEQGEADERKQAEAAAAATATKNASEKAEQEAAARRKALAADLGAVSAGIGKLTGSSVTFPEKSVFRESVAAATALALAAAKVAATVRGAVPTRSDSVLITGRTDQIEVLHAAYSFAQAIQALQKHAEKALEPLDGNAGIGALAEDGGEAAPEPPDSMLGALVTLAASAFDLLSVETTVSASNRSASELETHVAVIHALLEKVGQEPVQNVMHETIGIQSPTSDLRDSFENLKQQVPMLDARVNDIAQQIKALGDSPDPAVLAPLTAAKDIAEGAAAKISDFITRASTSGDTTKQTPLQGALGAERLMRGQAAAVKYVAVVLPARIAADQVALKRRMFAPRVVVTASATIDVLLLEVATGQIKAAAAETAEHAFQVRFPMAWSGDRGRLLPSLDPLGGVFASGS
jgi:hypothetical protein